MLTESDRPEGAHTTARAFLAPDRELVLLLVTGVAFVWLLLRMLHFNSSGTCDPRTLPSELVP